MQTASPQTPHFNLSLQGNPDAYRKKLCKKIKEHHIGPIPSHINVPDQLTLAQNNNNHISSGHGSGPAFQ